MCQITSQGRLSQAVITINTTHWRHVLLGEAGPYWEAPFICRGGRADSLAVLCVALLRPQGSQCLGVCLLLAVVPAQPHRGGETGVGTSLSSTGGKEETLIWTTSSWLRRRAGRFSEKSHSSQKWGNVCLFNITLSMRNSITNRNFPNLNPVSHHLAQKQTTFLWYCSLLSMPRHLSEGVEF